MGFWFVLILIIILVAAWPTWPYSRSWGYAPAGSTFAAILLLFLMVWLGLIAFSWPWYA